MEAKPQTRSWKGWRDQVARSLEARTGQSLHAWNRRIRDLPAGDEPSLRAWLTREGVSGYGATLLVWERFGYPEFITADPDQLIAAQYEDRPALRPVLDAILATLPAIGSVTIQARKTYVSLVSPRRTFAVVQPTTKNRIDLALRLDYPDDGGRLLPAKGIGGGEGFNVRIGLSTADEVDPEVTAWLERAYKAAS